LRDPKYALPSASFDAQMRLLSRLGYKSLRLEEFIGLHAAGSPLPRRHVVITFDDGYADNSGALGLLQRLGFSATIFLVTGDVGGLARWRQEEIGAVPMLSWAEVRRLATAGVEFGAHSLTHPNIALLPAAEAGRQIEQSRVDIMRVLGDASRCFAYPHGAATEETHRLAANAGYVAALSTVRALSTLDDNPMYLPRVQVYGNERLATFWLRLRLGDNPFDYLPHRRRSGSQRRTESQRGAVSPLDNAAVARPA
jgi:peptidoglycan/xylan/chitin deacetylase (PgdA/CDA1 family)